MRPPVKVVNPFLQYGPNIAHLIPQMKKQWEVADIWTDLHTRA